MQRRQAFAAALAGLLGVLAAPAIAQEEGAAAPRRRRSARAAAPPAGTSTECTREAPCTGPRGGRYWIDANGRRRSIRRPRGSARAAASSDPPAR